MFLVAEPHAWTTSIVHARTRNAIEWLSEVALRWAVKRSDAVVYVTNRTFQRRFPTRPGVPTLARSNVRLSLDSMIEAPRTSDSFFSGDVIRLVFVGQVNSFAKGIDTLLVATRILCDRGLTVTLTVVGGGKILSQLVELAVDLGIRDAVHFAGHVNDRSKITEILDTADIFTLPSLTEGVPRSAIEAMARGLPCVGSRVGGIPELIEDQLLFQAGDPEGLAGVIQELYRARQRLGDLSAANLRKARQYLDATDPDRLQEFYETLRTAHYPRRTT